MTTPARTSDIRPAVQLRDEHVYHPAPPISFRDLPGLPSPTRAPPPPPTSTLLLSTSLPSRTPDSTPGSVEPLKPIFRPLENYIAACFSNVEGVNASFLTPRQPPLLRSISEGAAVEKIPHISPTNETTSFPELDAKMLLLGDFAENGTWWTGKASDTQQEPTRIVPRTSNESTADRTDARSPHIDWNEVGQWYGAISAAGRSWRSRASSLPGFDANNKQEALFEQIDNEISASAQHLQRMVLKAAESLLRRPGRPLRKPGDCRFLLILLANPLLHPAEHQNHMGSAGSIARTGNSSRVPKASLKPPSNNPHSPKNAGRLNDVTPGVASFRHSGILKRILGLISTLPSDCHQCFVSWFSRFDEQHVRRLVDLVNIFVSHRLSRTHRRKRSNSQDPMAGLIPDISGPGAGTSAQLHAALGVASATKSDSTGENFVGYSMDWQVKAAAKVMSLLFSANNNDWPAVPQDGGKSSNPVTPRVRATSGARKRTHRHGQLIPTSSFYNIMLDLCDLIADFEVWESRRGKFSFCQYPMFLSIWAKIRIMEHDAHRQMEIKAREAFFDSIMSRKVINQYLVLRVRRDCLVEDSLRGVSEVVGTGQEEIKKGLRIDFVGEEGLDSGGLRKEWFLLLVREIFDPEHGLFTYDEDSQYCYFNPYTFETSDQYFLVGALLGLAIYNSTILDVALPPFAFRKLLASAPSYTGPATFHSRPACIYTLDDLAEYRPELAQGLRQLLSFEGDVESTFCRDFVAVGERYGQPVNIPLCPNGDKRPVTNTNRREFVDLYIRYLLDTSVARQYEPFKRGFFTVCGGNALSLFRPEEIELLIRGSDESLDVPTLQSVAVYDNWGSGFDPNKEPVIVWFWNAFINASPKDQRKLLSFITASDRIPAMGAASLTIKIVCHGVHQDRFPTARTCFNMIALYKYPTRKILETKLWTAVSESEGFGIK